MDKEFYDKEREKLKQRSTSGGTGRRREKRITMQKSQYIKRLKVLVATSVISTMLALGIGNVIIENFQDSLTLSSLSRDFQMEVINPETHRTNDNKHYFYDYSDLAKYIKSMDNFDEGVYFLTDNIGDYQTGLVLKYTDYGSFTNYKEAKGYESTDAFRKDMQKRILVTEEIKEKEQELAKMQKEHAAPEYEEAI